MNRRQFFALFVCSLIPWWIGSGLMPMLPLYAAHLGAAPALVGNYLSLIFFALATGTVVGGWLSVKIRRYRQLLMVVAAIGVVTTWLMGQISVIWHLIVLNATVWFALGITLALLTVLATRNTPPQKRGRIFGLLAMTSALGGVLGGPTGFIVDQWGYAALFAIVACAWPLQIVAALLLKNPNATTVVVPIAKAEQAMVGAPRLASSYLLLLLAALLFSTGGFAGTLARSLTMEAQGFPSVTITLLAALGSGVSLFVSPWLGQLSDHMDRRRLLSLVYLTGALALLVMAFASTTVDFALVALLTAVSSAERGISSALLSDLLPEHQVGQGMSLFDGIKWCGGVVGLAGTGYLIQQIGLSQAIILSSALPILALLLIFRLRTESATAMQATAVPHDPVWPVQQADSTF